MQLLEEARTLGRGGQGRHALLVFRKLLVLFPESAEAWAEYAGQLLTMNQPEAALEASVRSLEIRPNFQLALGIQATAFSRQGRLQESEDVLIRLISLDPQQTRSRLDLTRCYIKKEQLDRASSVLRQAAELAPGNADVSMLLVDIYTCQEKWTELHQEMLRQIDMNYTGAVAEWERSCVNLNFGVMPLGWQQHESRWQHPTLTTPVRPFIQPLWDGESFEGKSLLLHWEQGFGDTLMLVRYAPMVKQLGGRVLLLAQPELADLVATCDGVDEVHVEGALLPHFDLHLPLMSLPRVFKTTLESIPAQVPYLDVPKKVPNRIGISQLLASSKADRRVGISWASSPDQAACSQKSIRRDLLRPLGALSNINWYALQHQMPEVPPLPGIVSLSPLLSNFSDTAYAVSGMDIVITIDTVIAHLAGAMGVPTLLLLNYLPDWRWLMGRRDSPWYPSMQVYRQPRAGDWDALIQQIVKDCE